MSDLFVPDITNNIISFIDTKKYFDSIINFFFCSKYSLNFLLMKNITWIPCVEKTLEKVIMKKTAKLPLNVIENIFKIIPYDFKNYYAFKRSSITGYYEFFCYLIEKIKGKYDKNHFSKILHRSLCFAAWRKFDGNLKIIKLLLEMNVDPSANNNYFSRILIMRYYQKEYIELNYEILKLISKNELVDLSLNDSSFLKYALKVSHHDMIDLLLKNSSFKRIDPKVLRHALSNNNFCKFKKILSRINPLSLNRHLIEEFYFKSLENKNIGSFKIWFAKTPNPKQKKSIKIILENDDIILLKFFIKNCKINIENSKEDIIKTIFESDSIFSFKFLLNIRFITFEMINNYFISCIHRKPFTVLIFFIENYLEQISFDNKITILEEYIFSLQTIGNIIEKILNDEDICKHIKKNVSIKKNFIASGNVEYLKILLKKNLVTITSNDLSENDEEIYARQITSKVKKYLSLDMIDFIFNHPDYVLYNSNKFYILKKIIEGNFYFGNENQEKVFQKLISSKKFNPAVERNQLLVLAIRYSRKEIIDILLKDSLVLKAPLYDALVESYKRCNKRVFEFLYEKCNFYVDTADLHTEVNTQKKAFDYCDILIKLLQQEETKDCPDYNFFLTSIEICISEVSECRDKKKRPFLDFFKLVKVVTTHEVISPIMNNYFMIKSAIDNNNSQLFEILMNHPKVSITKEYENFFLRNINEFCETKFFRIMLKKIDLVKNKSFLERLFRSMFKWDSVDNPLDRIVPKTAKKIRLLLNTGVIDISKNNYYLVRKVAKNYEILKVLLIHLKIDIKKISFPIKRNNLNKILCQLTK